MWKKDDSSHPKHNLSYFVSFIGVNGIAGWLTAFQGAAAAVSAYFDKLLEQEGKKEPVVFGGVVVRRVPCLFWQKSWLPAFKNKKK